MREATQEVIMLATALKTLKATATRKAAARKQEIARIKVALMGEQILKNTRAIARQEAEEYSRKIRATITTLEEAGRKLTRLRYAVLKEPLVNKEPGVLVVRLLADWQDNQVLRPGGRRAIERIKKLVAKGRLIEKTPDTVTYHIRND
jgi:hypothetical protein